MEYIIIYMNWRHIITLFSGKRTKKIYQCICLRLECIRTGVLGNAANVGMSMWTHLKPVGQTKTMFINMNMAQGDDLARQKTKTRTYVMWLRLRKLE